MDRFDIARNENWAIEFFNIPQLRNNSLTYLTKDESFILEVKVKSFKPPKAEIIDQKLIIGPLIIVFKNSLELAESKILNSWMEATLQRNGLLEKKACMAVYFMDHERVIIDEWFFKGLKIRTIQHSEFNKFKPKEQTVTVEMYPDIMYNGRQASQEIKKIKMGN